MFHSTLISYSAIISDSCRYHPGVPVFHDALKSWSCCEKKSTDFSVFLDMPVGVTL